MKTTEEVLKEELDRQCAEKLGTDDSFECEHSMGKFDKDIDEFVVDNHNCWLCHKHDLLAHRLSSALEGAGK